MRHRTLLAVALVALSAGSPALGRNRDAREGPEVWVASKVSHHVAFGPDGSPDVSRAAAMWRPPIAQWLATDASLDAIAAVGRERLDAIGTGPFEASTGAPEGSATSAPLTDARPEDKLAEVVDVNGDGVDEIIVERVVAGDSVRRFIDLRSGADGALLWEREVPYPAYLVTPNAATGPVAFLFEQRIEDGASLPASTRKIIVTVTALGADGSTAWARELRGTEDRGVLITRLRDMPVVEGVGDVRGDGAADVVLMLSSAWRSNLSGSAVPSSEEAALAVLDGKDGSLMRGPDVSGSRSFEPIGDIDGDGKGEIYENRRQGLDGLSGVVGGDARVRWMGPEPLRLSHGGAAGIADLDGDGDADLLSHHMGSCEPRAALSCRNEIAGLARDGSTGEALTRWDTWPRVAAQIDDDAAVETIVAESRFDYQGKYGVRLLVSDANGQVTHHTERLYPMPEDPWQPYVVLANEGDVDADGVSDWAWTIGRYDRTYQQPAVVEEDVRVSGATAAALPPLSSRPFHWWIGRFDGTGDDHFTFAGAQDGDIQVRASDGFDGLPLWVGEIEGSGRTGFFTETGDLDGDGRDEVLVELIEMSPSNRVERLVLFDGATGALRWDQLVA